MKAGQPKVIIAIDPGGTTGIAWCRMDQHKSGQHVAGYQHIPMQVGRCNEDIGLKEMFVNLGGMCRWAEPFTGATDVHIVVERFEFRADERYRDKIDYIAAEVIGALRLWRLDRSYIKLAYQSASQAVGDDKTKCFWSDDKVKTLGLWVPNYRHAMDATRHLLHYRLFTLGHKDLLEPFRPALGSHAE